MPTYIIEINTSQLEHLRRALAIVPDANEPAADSLKLMLDPELKGKGTELAPSPVVNGLCFG